MKHDFAILTDFGSTYTKMACVDMNEKRVVAADKFPSTVHTDATIAMRQCFDCAEAEIGAQNFNRALKLSTSSAAGGLRMAVVGLTKSVSATAGRNASFSAGAKIVSGSAGAVTQEVLGEIESSDAEIILFCGGHENGNTQLMIRNAAALAESRIAVPIIYAGNSCIAADVRRILLSGGKECFLAANIIPDVGELNIEPVTTIIRELFMNRITNMNGVGEVQLHLDAKIIPTPAAVLEAGKLLSTGGAAREGLGPVMMADVGGATTDIYSYIENLSYKGARRVGSPELFAKRTVEGDMGMRESSVCLIKETGEENFSRRSGISQEEAEEAINKRITQREYLADTDKEKKIDKTLACCAVDISARRHAGYLTREFIDGCQLVQHGKNLTDIDTIIGIGGVVVNDPEPDEILKNAQIRSDEREEILLPEDLKVLVDRDYVFYAAGLLKEYDEEAALSIMKRSLGLV